MIPFHPELVYDGGAAKSASACFQANGLGRADIAASLTNELESIPVNVNHAITLSEKLRISAQSG